MKSIYLLCISIDPWESWGEEFIRIFWYSSLTNGSFDETERIAFVLIGYVPNIDIINNSLLSTNCSRYFL